MNDGYLRRTAWIEGATAKASFPRFDRQNVFLMDPEQPKVDANQLLNQRGGRMLNPQDMNHNCPFCNRTMAWDLFMAHAEYCFKKWRKVAYRKHRVMTSG